MAPTTVTQYLRELPAERRAEIARVRAVIRKHLPRGYREGLGWGIITYEVPLSRFPDTYNGKPLMFAGLGAQKSYNVLYLMLAYQSADRGKRLTAAFKAAGKKLDMGKSCIRFRRADDLALETIGELVAETPVSTFLAEYQKARGGTVAARRKAKPKTARAR